MRAALLRWTCLVSLATPVCVVGDPTAEATAPDAPVEGRSDGAAPGAPELEEEIVVTGSRVKRKDLTTPAPVTVITREELTAGGARTVGELLQLLPEQGNALNRQVNNGGDGSTRVSLRSLGDYRTLVLLNGRRYVAGGLGADSAVDLNAIPAAAIERIEVLKDGASPMYGSDAMGGVVNVITRKRWSGVEASTTVGTSSRGDATSVGVSLTAGATGASGSFLLTGSYEELGSAMAGDRAFSATPLGFDFASGTWASSGSPAGPEPVIGLSPDEVGVADGNDLWNALVAAHPTADAFIRDPTAPLGWRPYLGDALPRDGGDGYNFQPENYLVTPLRVLTLFATGERPIAEGARIFWEASWSNRRSDQMLATLPLFTATEGTVVSADNVYNPFGRDVPAVLRRLMELDRRRFAQDVDTFRVVAGLDGVLGALGGASWELSATWGRTRATDQRSGFLSGRGLAAALGPSFIDPGANGVVDTPVHGAVAGDDVATCGTPSQPIASCVPLDLFGGPGAITPEMLAPLAFTGVARGTNELLSLQANAGRELLRLASERPVGLATGYEYRRVAGELVPDTVQMSGDRRGIGTQPTRGSADVHEVYAELAIPVVSGRPLLDDVEALAAARAFRHGGFDADWTWKVGGRWRPARDVTLRGTASTAYRVPSIGELFTGDTLGDFDFVEDPCADLSDAPPARVASCTAAGVPAGGTRDFSQVPAPFSGNPDLRPETARVLTAGVVLEPRFAPRLSVTVDWWQVRVDRVIGPVGGWMIVELCYPTDVGAAPQLCDLVERDTASGRLLRVSNRPLNTDGSEDAAGVDLAVRYALPSSIGRLEGAVEGTWLARHDLEFFDGTVFEGRGNYDLLLNPEWRANALLGWALGGLSAGGTLRFTSRFEECGATDDFTGETVPWPCSLGPQFRRSVDASYVLDAFVAYELRTRAGRTKLMVGAKNLLDRAPPLVAFSVQARGTPFDGTGYDLLGRYLYAQLSHGF